MWYTSRAMFFINEVTEMNRKDLSEIKRRLNPDKRYPSVLRGCYLGADGHVIAEFAKSVGALAQEECEKFMAIFRKCLSGTEGQNLLNLDFTPEQMEADAHHLLTGLCDTGLQDVQIVEDFFRRAIAWRQEEFVHLQSVDDQQAADNYLVLLLHDGYDVPYRDDNGDLDKERSESILNYILCAVCPVKQLKPALRYFEGDSEFHAGASDQVVGMPEMGFMFPAFEERSANIHRALYYTRDTGDLHASFIEGMLNADVQMTAQEQKETFQSILTETLAEECSMDLMQNVHETISTMIEEQKADKTAEALCMDKQDVKRVLEECGVSEEKTEAFAARYEESFGEQTAIPAVNMIAPKQFKVDTPSVTIRVDPQHSDLIQTRILDGKSYIVILADGDVEVNGVKITC